MVTTIIFVYISIGILTAIVVRKYGMDFLRNEYLLGVSRNDESLTLWSWMFLIILWWMVFSIWLFIKINRIMSKRL